VTPSNGNNDSEEGYIVEYIVIGNSVKATAFDPVTLREVSVVGARELARQQLGKLAVKKLIYMLKKNIAK
jgi:hypothetical protein